MSPVYVLHLRISNRGKYQHDIYVKYTVTNDDAVFCLLVACVMKNRYVFMLIFFALSLFQDNHFLEQINRDCHGIL